MRIWRTSLPFHAFFLVIALIGYFKVGTMAGFWVRRRSREPPDQEIARKPRAGEKPLTE